MELTGAGQLVKVDAGGAPLDGIVFDIPSSSKVVVAVLERGRGPVFRTVHPRMLADRPDDRPGDRALRLLIRRTPPPAGASGPPGGAGKRGQAGHTRAAMHRTTGR